MDRGIAVLIPPDASKRRGARPGWDGGPYAFMRRVLATERGGGLYKQRQPMIEPVFGQTKHNRGIARFQRRRRAAVHAEWRLITATRSRPPDGREPTAATRGDRATGNNRRPRLARPSPETYATASGTSIRAASTRKRHSGLSAGRAAPLHVVVDSVKGGVLL